MGPSEMGYVLFCCLSTVSLKEKATSYTAKGYLRNLAVDKSSLLTVSPIDRTFLLKSAIYQLGWLNDNGTDV